MEPVCNQLVATQSAQKSEGWLLRRARHYLCGGMAGGVVAVAIAGYLFARHQQSTLDEEHLSSLTIGMSAQEVRQVIGEPTWKGVMPSPDQAGVPVGESAPNTEEIGQITRWVYNRPFGVPTFTIYFDEKGQFKNYFYSNWFD